MHALEGIYTMVSKPFLGLSNMIGQCDGSA